ncbi:hypothetical protein PHMEG_0005925 [Phytophthora megakarya]|uniref:ZSWIM1/3 RNaseH-like domain-containing protein n=1 Tax=Phytophthora megakarya TaxID=4795 RepID=A0A225WRC7_9STRA|nr:hypothetical protein PHMEG_0005925 [Phytophthora megakarya]
MAAPSNLAAKGIGRITLSAGLTAKLSLINAVLSCTHDGEYSVRVNSHIATHNHPVTADVFYSYTESRKVTSSTILGAVKTMRIKKEKYSPVPARCVWEASTPEGRGKHNCSKSYTSLDDNVRLNEVLQDFSEGPDNVVNIFNDRTTRQTSCITFQTAHMRRMTRKFPEVVCIDATYGTNINRYRLFSFMVTDEFGVGAFEQHSLLDGESSDTMASAFRAFKKNNLTWKYIKVEVLDKYFTEILLLKRQLPHATIILCHFHVIDYPKRDVSKGDDSTLDNNSYNRLEASWDAAKGILDRHMPMNECVDHLLFLQQTAEDLYRIKSHKIRFRPNSRYDEELQLLAN